MVKLRLALMLGIVVALLAPGDATSAGGSETWTETLLHVFGSGTKGSFLDGKTPAGRLIVDSAGDLYGAARYGAASGTTPECRPIQNGQQLGSGCGMVYELSPPAAGTTYWPESVLHVFAGGTDAEYPVGGLVSGSGGALYGVAVGGYSNTCRAGCVYAITPGTLAESIVYRWPGSSGGGSNVNGDLAVAANGSLYGTTMYGGTNNFGTVFELRPPVAGSSVWTKRVLHAFTNGLDGGAPSGALLIDAHGALFGTTRSGGSSTACNYQGPISGGYCGVAFELAPPKHAPGPWVETVLHSFTGKRDGGIPNGGLIADGRGSLFGTTAAGGRTAFDLTGIVFELRPAPWTLHVVHTFGAREGTTPVGGLTSWNDARVLYGVTSAGGPSDEGSVFRLRLGSTGWTETILHSFSANSDGYQPLGGLVTYECRLFGTNALGGPYTGAFLPAGTVFEVSDRSANVTSSASKKDCRECDRSD